MVASSRSIDGRLLELVVSEPWEYAADKIGESPQLKIVRTTLFGTRCLALAELVAPVAWPEPRPTYVVVELPSSRDVAQELLDGASVDCSLVGVPDSATLEGPPWGSDRWRGGFALRGTLKLTG